MLTPGGTLVSVPTHADLWTFPVLVRNAAGQEATGFFILTVNAPPVWQPLPPDALVLPEGLPFSIALEAIDPDGQSVAYAIAAGALPGAALDPATGVLAVLRSRTPSRSPTPRRPSGSTRQSPRRRAERPTRSSSRRRIPTAIP